MPRPGQVLGLVGSNGCGKSTALKILAGKVKPNLGRYDTPPDWEEILVHFRGSELQNYFTKILEDTMKATIKPQYVDHIPRAVKGNVGELLKQKDEVNNVAARPSFSVSWRSRVDTHSYAFSCRVVSV
jgi:ATP-binding cassette subfamily E protein 1